MHKYQIEYSNKEKLLITALGLNDYASNSSIMPGMLYREMAVICFLEKINNNISDSVRNCLNELNKPNGLKRLTPEFDNLITI